MKKRIAHAWNVSPKEAVNIQKELREELLLKPLVKEVRTIAGVDVSFNKFSEDVYAGVVVFSYPNLTVCEYSCVKEKVSFPYIPGLLSFREIPPLLSAWNMLSKKPDVVMVDGHGIAHPRRLGIAAHFSLVSDTPAFGCAKKILFGSYAMPDIAKGSHSSIIDPKTKEVIGAAVRTKDKVSPVFISPGNGLALSDALPLTLQSARNYRLPEPTRQAHILVNRFRKGELKRPHGGSLEFSGPL